VIDLQEATKKKVFCLLLFEGTFTSFFSSIKSHKEVTKQYGRNQIKVFLTILLDDKRIRISDQRIRIRMAQKHTNPDPEHWIPYHLLKYYIGTLYKKTGSFSSKTCMEEAELFS
jgi:hypothetical protein